MAYGRGDCDLEKLVLKARGVTKGLAKAEALVTRQTLSGWGGIDPVTGVVIETGNELEGKKITGKVLVFRGAKGSSGWSEAFHARKLENTNPAAVIFSEMTTKIVAGMIAMQIPSVTELEENPFECIKNGDMVTVDADNGVVIIEKADKS